MIALVKIKEKIDNIFANYEAELLSEQSITSECSGEGKPSIRKTAHKGDIIYLNTEAVNNPEMIIGNTYEVKYVQSMYAKNPDKPIVLNLTFVK